MKILNRTSVIYGLAESYIDMHDRQTLIEMLMYNNFIDFKSMSDSDLVELWFCIFDEEIALIKDKDIVKLNHHQMLL